MSSYLEQIEQKLQQKHREIIELEIAHRVIEGLKAENEPTKAQALKIEAPKASGKITIRRALAAPAKGGGTVGGKAERERYRSGVRAYLAEHGPVRTSTLMEHFGIADGTKAEKQVLYQVMYDMKRVGELIRDDEMVYHLSSDETVQD